MNHRGGKREKIEFTDELVQKVADLASKNNSASEISKETKLSYPIVRRLMKSPEYQAEIKNALRQRLSHLVGLTVKVIQDKLEEGDLDAAKIVLKVHGALEQEPIAAAKADSQLVVVMPGAQAPITKEVVIDVSPQNGSDQERTGTAPDAEPSPAQDSADDLVIRGD